MITLIKKINLSPFIMLLLLAGIFLPQLGQAAPPAGKGNVVSEPVLNRTINEVLQQPEFAWRLPREQTVEKKDASSGFVAHLFAPLLHSFQEIGTWLGKFIQNAVHWLAENIGNLLDWLQNILSNKEKKETRDFDFREFSRPAAFLLIAALAFIIIFLLIKALRNRPVVTTVSSEPVQSVPDLAAETTTADQLEEDQWLALAGDMLDKSELRLALRAFFLASLALLGRHRLITLAPFKTNRDYLRELSRSDHALTGVIEPFTENINLFEKSWYGDHRINSDILARVRKNASQLRFCCG